MRGVLTLLFFALALLFICLFATALFGLAIGEVQVGASFMLLASLGGLISGTAIITSFDGKHTHINRAQSLLALVLIWLLLPIFAAVPFVWAGVSISYLTGLFEAVSGLTTTSATLLIAENLPVTLIGWRATLEWIGGFYVLASVLFLLAPTGIGGLPQLRGFLFLEQDGQQFAFRQFMKLLLRYILITLVVVMLFLILGAAPYLAVLAAFAGISTGGYMPLEPDLFSLMPKSGQVLLAFILLYAATGLLWQSIDLRKLMKRIKRTREPLIMIILFGILTLLYTNQLNQLNGASNLSSIGDHVLEGLFASASIISTSGLETRFGIIQLLPEILVLIVVLVGGSVVSNAGGIKVYRFVAMLMLSARELGRVVYPSIAVSKNKQDASWYSDISINTVWTVLISAIIVIMVGTICLAGTGLSFSAAFSASIAYFANAGPIYPALTPPLGSDDQWLGYRDMTQSAHSIGMILMLLGRLEIIVFLASLNPKYWFEQ